MRFVWDEPMPWMEDSHLATVAEADAEYARNVGMETPERAWILSDRDVWYRNPAYTGPAVPHPEDYEPEGQDRKSYTVADIDDEVPF